MPDRTAYEGETQRFTEYSTPPADQSTARFESAPPATIPAPAGQPYSYQHRGRRKAPLLGLLALLLGLWLLINNGTLPITGGFIERSSSFADSYTAQKLALDIGNGNVTLARAAGDDIEVEAISHGYGWTPGAAERAAERIEPRINVEGDTLRITEDRFDALNMFGRSSYVEYRIALPEGVAANVSTGSGDIEASGTGGAIELQTGSGDVTLYDSQGALLHTGSGNINVDGISGELRASTGSGDIEIDGASSAVVELQTGSGNIDFAGSLGSEDRHSMQTGSGNIELVLPDEASVELRAETSSGDIEIDDRWQADVGENSATARLGDGGAELELRASSGNISVEAE